MTNDETKFILGAYRSNGRDSCDPRFAEALEHARVDPVLSEWFSRERAFDELVTAKLSEVRAPARLKAEILVGRDMPRSGRFRVSWINLGMAAAATLMICAGIFWQSFRAVKITPSALVSKAMDVLDRGPVLATTSPDVSVLKAWLTSHNSPMPDHLPASFAALQGLGCQQLEISGNKVSLICFQHNGKPLHLFVMNAGALSPDARHSVPDFSFRNGWALSQWSDGHHACLVAMRGSVEELQHLL